MGKVKIVLNGTGIRSLLKSGEMQALLSKHANQIAGSQGREARTYVAPTRAVAEVRGDDGDNGLLKAVHK